MQSPIHKRGGGQSGTGAASAVFIVILAFCICSTDHAALKSHCGLAQDAAPK